MKQTFVNAVAITSLINYAKSAKQPQLNRSAIHVWDMSF